MVKNILRKFKNLSDNSKIVVKNVAGAFAIRGLSLVVSVFTMPAYIRFFNNESTLGLWFTIVSVLNWILNFDLGIGNGLRNHLTTAIAEKKHDEVKKYLSSAYVSTGALCIVISVLFITLFDYVNWNKVFNIDNSIISLQALSLTVKIVFLSIMLQLFFKLITSVLYALQQSSVNNFLSLCTSILTLLIVLIFPSSNNEKNMVVMAVVHGVAVIAPLFITTIIVFWGKSLKGCWPRFRYVEKKYIKDILALGGAFLYVQIMYMVIMNTNEYLITLFSGSENVVNYQIYSKPFYIGATVFNLALTPMWSAVGKAFAESNYNWINKIYKKLCMIAILSGLLEIFIVPFLQPIIKIWLGDSAIEINYMYGIAFAVLFTLQIFNGVFSTIENGMNQLRNQAIIFSIGAIVKIPIAWALVQLGGSWISIVWANIIVLALYCVMEPFYIKKILKKKVV